ncbi:hypothetical protein EJ04DRAFT_592999 [Polyplosphaeria fusca]|uniref:F-box domain-containing protein n=1 Tax=Polyplosphaeria fusca TaxID=682080 RepID=A0A9P4R6M4_9PLEO|nr:hypothetical protein EJ04DRAFT_592999 [Polyplosphaeria fusca]
MRILDAGKLEIVPEGRIHRRQLQQGRILRLPGSARLDWIAIRRGESGECVQNTGDGLWALFEGLGGQVDGGKSNVPKASRQIHPTDSGTPALPQQRLVFEFALATPVCSVLSKVTVSEQSFHLTSQQQPPPLGQSDHQSLVNRSFSTRCLSALRPRSSSKQISQSARGEPSPRAYYPSLPTTSTRCPSTETKAATISSNGGIKLTHVYDHSSTSTDPIEPSNDKAHKAHKARAKIKKNDKPSPVLAKSRAQQGGTGGNKKPRARLSEVEGLLASQVSVKSEGKKTGFLDLPGEIRNQIYEYAVAETEGPWKQAFVKHAPRRRGLRARTNRKPSLRPFLALTQVCRLVRVEFRPWFLNTQEMIVDINDMEKYVKTFYPADDSMIRFGQIKIGLSLVIKANNRGNEGIDILPVLRFWIGTFELDMGFCIYYKDPENPEPDDEEIMDLHRLIRVNDSRDSDFFATDRWQGVLEHDMLAEVRVVRAPARRYVLKTQPGSAEEALEQLLLDRNGEQNFFYQTAYSYSWAPKPFIHLLFKPEWAEDWMNSRDCRVPSKWLRQHGFGEMQYFDIKVGRADLPARRN